MQMGPRLDSDGGHGFDCSLDYASSLHIKPDRLLGSESITD